MPSFRHARHSPAQCVLGTYRNRLFTGCNEEETHDSIKIIASFIRHVGLSV